ncbi:MAG: restriction endonuclease subunit S [Acidobacteriaceae bacterium]
MAGEWREVTVGQIAAAVRNALVGGPFGSNLVTRDYAPSGVPVIRGQNMGGRWVAGEFVFISDAKADALEANLARHGDIVFTQRGTLGQVSVVPKHPNVRYLVSQSQMKLTVNRELADPLFFYYVFSTAEQQDYIRQHAIQTGVPHTNLGVLRETPVPLPPIEEQRAIAHILGTLDDKIELNRRMSETLEAMARALFKAWFVDFVPVRAKIEGRWQRGQSLPGLPVHIYDLFPDCLVDSELGEIPEGWEVRSLDQIARFLNGLALQKFPPSGEHSLPVIKIAQLRAGNTIGADRASSNLERDYIVQDGDILFSWSGSLECVLWAGGPGALNQHLFKVTSEAYPKWFCFLGVHLHLDDFRHIAAGKATTMGHIQRHHLTDATLAIPPTALLRAADAVMAPMIDDIWRLREQSRTLAALRDTLLPKLISGELRVPDAERWLEATQ